MSYQLFIEGQPVPKGRPRLGKKIYTPKRTREWEQYVFYSARKLGGPLEGALKIDIVFFMKQRIKKPQKIGEYHIFTPDLDNLVKALLDGLAPLYNDDSQLAEVNARKIYSCCPGVWFHIKPLTSPPSDQLYRSRG